MLYFLLRSQMDVLAAFLSSRASSIALNVQCFFGADLKFQGMLKYRYLLEDIYDKKKTCVKDNFTVYAKKTC